MSKKFEFFNDILLLYYIKLIFSNVFVKYSEYI